MQSLRQISRAIARVRPSARSTRQFNSCCAFCSLEKMEHLEKNAYFDRYKAKLERLHESAPGEFQAKVESMLETKAPKKPASQQTKPTPSSSASQPPLPGLSAAQQSQQAPAKGLDSVMKMELIQDKNAEEISQIWKEYHSKKDGIFAIIESKEYDQISSKAKEYPTFLYPVPRAQGYEFMVGQFSGDQCYFTPLIAYQNYKENAPYCLTLNHYPELSKEKGIVLMNGEYDTQLLNTQDATILAQQVQMYYGHQGAGRFHLVEKLNKDPDSFKHSDLISEFENIAAGNFIKKS